MKFVGALVVGLVALVSQAFAGNSIHNVGGERIVLAVPDSHCVLERSSPTDALYRGDLEKYTGPAIAVVTNCETQYALRLTSKFDGVFDFMVFKPVSSLFGWDKRKWMVFDDKTSDWPVEKLLEVIKSSWEPSVNREDLRPDMVSYEGGAFQSVSAHETEDGKTLARATLMFPIKDELFILQAYNFKEVYSPEFIEQRDLDGLKALNEAVMILTESANR